MAVGLSDGQSYPDETQWLASADHRSDKQRSDQSEMQSYSTSGDFSSRFGPAEQQPLTPANHLGSNIDDRREQSFGGMLLGMVGENLTMDKVKTILQHPLAPIEQTRTAALPSEPSELGNQLGLNDIGRGLQAPTEPAGALESSGGSIPTRNVYGVDFGPGITDRGSRIVAKNTTAEKLGLNPYTTEDDIDSAIHIALSVGAGTMAGVRSKAINLADLGHAQVLEANGIHPDVITQKTGFSRGADSRWKYEIDDSKSSFDRKWVDNAEYKKAAEPKTKDPFEQVPFTYNVGERVSKLPDILDHPELYKAYPHLRDTDVIWKRDAPTSHADPINNEIVMADVHKENHGVLMHEVQHLVQEHEGFAKGGTAGRADENFQLKYGQSSWALKLANEEFKRLLNKPVLTKEEHDVYEQLVKIQDKYKEYKKAANETAYEYYLRLAGEVEARNTDTRLLLTAAERRKLTPRMTEDVNPRDQINIPEPVMTSAYGVRNPKTGQVIK